jgi:radical SAM superfamily enzyme YgiQ (UPF0313 family)
LERIDQPKQGRGINLAGVNGVYYYDNGQIIKNDPRALIEDIDRLPIPDRSLIENFNAYLAPPGIIRLQFMKGTTPVMASRGCPYSCIFCASHKIHGKRARIRTPEKVIDELIYLNETYGVRGVMFWDDTFGISKKWIRAYCREYLRRKPDVIWGCQTRANIAQDFEVLATMKQAGCVQIDIGVESGSDKVLKALNKGTTTEMIRKSFKNLNDLKMNSFTTYIIGNPEETEEDIEMTYNIAKQAPRGGVSFLILSPLPGTRLFELAQQNNWLVHDYHSFDERWTTKESDQPVMAINQSTDQIVAIRNQLQNRFELKNNLMILRSFFLSPKFLIILVFIVISNPGYLFRAMKKRKIKDWMENTYQAFNARLQRR